MATVYEIGPFQLDPDSGVLLRLGVAEPLGKRAVDVLATLVRSARKPVTKDAIIDAAWRGLVVEEANLTVQISAIRRVLSQAPGGDRWIETLAGRGYRFTGPATVVRDGDAPEPRCKRLGNLPEPLASFVGRERELVELKRLLAKNRLLTIVGGGGIGKTRLAAQLAAEVADAYRDGVWFVDLAPLADAALVPSAAAQVFGVRDTAGRSLTEALCRHLEGQRALVLVDNCEHVLDAAARLIEAMLKGASEPAIVATSREPLRAYGEQLYWLQSLPLPVPAGRLEAVRQSDAVALFVDRAQHQEPGFVVDEANVAGIADLCTRLDGIPLALELAAPLVHGHSIDEINARLADRLAALTQGRSTALPRQQTLRATLDWSFERLSDEQRAMLRRASVFNGSFTTAAAADMLSVHARRATDVRELLEQLVMRSVVIADATRAGTRYRLLDTMRSYAREKLIQAGESAAVQRRHAQHYRTVLDGAHEAWLRLADEEWRTRYLPEVDNVRTALDWSLAIQGGDASLAIALAGGSGPLWTSLSLYGEGIARLEAAAGREPSRASRPDRARLSLWLGLLLEPSAPARAVTSLRRAVEIYRALSDAQGVAQSAICLARPLAITGQCDQAGVALATAESALERAGNLPKLKAAWLSNAATLKTLTNDFVAAQSLHRKALALYRELGSTLGTAGSLNNLANASWAIRDLDAAETALREAVAIHRSLRHGGRDPLGFALGNLAGVLVERGKIDEALEAAREGLPLLSGAGNAWLFIDHIALRSALAGEIAAAARLAGFADHAHALKGATREPNEARARERVGALLRGKLGGDRLNRLLSDGAGLTEGEACRLALEE